MENLNTSTWENKISELQKLVAQFDSESFAGFFAYFIKNQPDAMTDSDLNKFESKLKDYLYLIALNVFAADKGNTLIKFDAHIIETLAAKLYEIKTFNKKNFTEYSTDSIIHEMAFNNHFDNGVLSYVEQDLEKIRRVFTPFEEEIISDFGFDVNFLISVFKEIELLAVLRYKYLMEFSKTKEFREFIDKYHAGIDNFEEAFDQLPKQIQLEYSRFYERTYAFLMFSADDLYHRLDKNMVDKFLYLFSIEPKADSKVRYYSSESPFELRPILKLESGYMNLYGKQISIAIYKKLYSHFFSDKKHNDKIRKHREKSLEQKVVEIFKYIFPSKAAFIYENYFVTPNQEQDLLILYKGTAIIIETKASKLREPLRDVDKAIKRLRSDFKDSIQYGYEQCERVEDCFYEQQLVGIHDSKGNCLYNVKTSKIHSVFSIVVTLERFGSLQTDLSLLLQKGEGCDYPWSIYIDDLEVFLLALKSGKNAVSNFLSFLKYRKLLHGRMYAIDELDICATFMQNPEKFRQYAEAATTYSMFSPFEQNYFDLLYKKGKFRFKEKPLPDEYYLFGVPD